MGMGRLQSRDVGGEVPRGARFCLNCLTRDAFRVPLSLTREQFSTKAGEGWIPSQSRLTLQTQTLDGARASRAGRPAHHGGYGALCRTVQIA